MKLAATSAPFRARPQCIAGPETGQAPSLHGVTGNCLVDVFAYVKAFFGDGEDVAFAGDPDVEGGQEEDADDEGGDQTSYDHDGEGTLRIGTDGVGESGGQESEGGDQHGHHD